MKKNSTTKKTTKRTSKKEPTAHASAVAVMEFMNDGKIPDFLSNVVQQTVDRACEHLKPPSFKLSYEPEDARLDMELLTAVCRRTRMLHINDLENSKAGLARHILAIYSHPLTPVRLWNAIANFVTDGTNLKISACEVSGNSMVNTSGDISLVEEWNWSPQTIERIIELTNKYGEVSDASN